MKSCPTCNRTFDDTLSFCLVDGAVLSAPFEPPANQNTAPPTEVINPVSNLSIPTIVSPSSLNNPSETGAASGLPSKAGASPGRKSGRLYIAAAVVLLTIIGVGSVMFFVVRSTRCPKVIIGCVPYEDSKAVCYLSDAQSSFVPDYQNAGPVLNSLQAPAFLQRQILPPSVKANWTVSSGRIVEQYNGGDHIRIDTTGLAGREIVVNAALKSSGMACSNNPSISFIAK